MYSVAGWVDGLHYTLQSMWIQDWEGSWVGKSVGDITNNDDEKPG